MVLSVTLPPPSRNIRVRGRPDPAANDEVDSGVLRRRLKALADLAYAVVGEYGDLAHVTVAFRAGAVGDMEIPAERYDGFALLAFNEAVRARIRDCDERRW